MGALEGEGRIGGGVELEGVPGRGRHSGQMGRKESDG